MHSIPNRLAASHHSLELSPGPCSYRAAGANRGRVLKERNPIDDCAPEVDSIRYPARGEGL